jgi:hypothetical protein
MFSAAYAFVFDLRQMTETRRKKSMNVLAFAEI